MLGTDDRGIDGQDEEVDCNNEQKAANAALVVPADIKSVAKICEDHKPFPIKAFRKRFGAFFKNVKKALKKQPKKKGMKGIAWGEKPDVLPVVSFFFFSSFSIIAIQCSHHSKVPIQQTCKNNEQSLSSKAFLYEGCLGLIGSRIFVANRQQIFGISIDEQIWVNNIEKAADDQEG
ncbi:uncharacterized protein RHIMIDRAFT_265769, partial [Rhizopus microsporus ATCC 52813]